MSFGEGRRGKLISSSSSFHPEVAFAKEAAAKSEEEKERERSEIGAGWDEETRTEA